MPAADQRLSGEEYYRFQRTLMEYMLHEDAKDADKASDWVKKYAQSYSSEVANSRKVLDALDARDRDRALELAQSILLGEAPDTVLE